MLSLQNYKEKLKLIQDNLTNTNLAPSLPDALLPAENPELSACFCLQVVVRSVSLVEEIVISHEVMCKPSHKWSLAN